MAVGKISIDEHRKRIYIKEHFTGTKLNDDMIIRGMGDHVPKNDITIADTSDSRVNHMLNEKGWEVYNANKKEGTIISGIKALSKYTLIIDPDSPNAIFDFNNYIWHNKKLDFPKKENDHHPDGVRYAFMYMEKVGY